jgi:hypothetical protein
MKNFRRLALVAGVATLSAVAFSPKAQAQTANVDFNGSIGSACIINSVSNGTLANVDSKTLEATSLNGTPGSINVTCTNGTTFTVTDITDNGSSLTTGTYATGINSIVADVKDGNLGITGATISPDGVNRPQNRPTGVASILQAGPITNKDYSVVLTIRNISTDLSSGFYKVRVAVALTPQ